MSYVDITREFLHKELNAAESQILAARRKAPALIRRVVRQVLDRQAAGLGVLIPDALVNEIAEILTSVVIASLDECLDTIATLKMANDMLGSPEKMREMAAILSEIGASSEDLQIRKDRLPGLLAWDDGSASRTYELSIDDQARAVSKIAGNVASVSGVLRTHADDIESYYANLAGVVVGAVAAIGGFIAALLCMIGGALTLETGVGPIIGLIGGALSLAVSQVGVGVSALSAVQLFLANAQGSANKLNDAITAMPEWKAPRFAMVR